MVIPHSIALSRGPLIPATLVLVPLSRRLREALFRRALGCARWIEQDHLVEIGRLDFAGFFFIFIFFNLSLIYNIPVIR